MNIIEKLIGTEPLLQNTTKKINTVNKNFIEKNNLINKYYKKIQDSLFKDFKSYKDLCKACFKIYAPFDLEKNNIHLISSYFNWFIKDERYKQKIHLYCNQYIYSLDHYINKILVLGKEIDSRELYGFVKNNAIGNYYYFIQCASFFCLLILHSHEKDIEGLEKVILSKQKEIWDYAKDLEPTKKSRKFFKDSEENHKPKKEKVLNIYKNAKENNILHIIVSKDAIKKFRTDNVVIFGSTDNRQLDTLAFVKSKNICKNLITVILSKPDNTLLMALSSINFIAIVGYNCKEGERNDS